MAEEVCDRIGILQKGRIVALGTVSELRGQAGMDASLEEVFLKLTEESSEDGAVDSAGARAE